MNRQIKKFLKVVDDNIKKIDWKVSIEKVSSTILVMGITKVFCEIDKKIAVDKAYKQGYDDASKQFLSKYESLALQFINMEKDYKNQIGEYENLLNEYDKEISRMKKIIDGNTSTAEDNDYYMHILDINEKLKKLPA